MPQGCEEKSDTLVRESASDKSVVIFVPLMAVFFSLVHL